MEDILLWAPLINISLHYWIIVHLFYVKNCLLGLGIVGKYRRQKHMHSCQFLILSSVWSIEQTSRCFILKSLFFPNTFCFTCWKKTRMSALGTADWFQCGGINKCKKGISCVEELQGSQMLDGSPNLKKLGKLYPEMQVCVFFCIQISFKRLQWVNHRVSFEGLEEVEKWRQTKWKEKSEVWGYMRAKLGEALHFLHNGWKVSREHLHSQYLVHIISLVFHGCLISQSWQTVTSNCSSTCPHSSPGEPMQICWVS